MTTPPALPWGTRLGRPLRIWRVVIQLLVGLWWDSRRWSYPEGWSAERLAVRRRRQARWLTSEFLGLGSAFIKLGQPRCLPRRGGGGALAPAGPGARLPISCGGADPRR